MYNFFCGIFIVLQLNERFLIMRISFSDEEVKTLIDFFQSEEAKKINIDFSSILKKLKLEEKKPIAASKKVAIEKARNIRSKKIKEQLEKTINMMRLENKKLTLFSLSKESGISYVTVRKYKDYVNSLYPIE